jgi:hypothetical protein
LRGRIFRRFLRIFDHFGMMIPEQPGLQLALDDLPVFDAKLVAVVVPPFRNAAITNWLAVIEQRAFDGASKKLLAPGTGLIPNGPAPAIRRSRSCSKRSNRSCNGW